MLDLYSHVLTRISPKILAVGKNYIDHVKEMGGSQFPKDPVIFQKPTTSLLPPGESFFYLPKHGRPIHHEVELGIMIGKKGKDVRGDDLKKMVAGYFVGVDMTDRDLQWDQKKNGMPWDLSKGQDGFLPVSDFVPYDAVRDPENLSLVLKINGEIKQNGNTKNMFYKIPKIIEYCSSYMTLNPGDLIITGTPSGVGPIKEGDVVEALLLEEGKLLAERKFVVKKQAFPKL